MLDFPQVQEAAEPSRVRMSLMDYVKFCAFCVENNPKITPQNCLNRKSGEESMTEPFRL